MTATDTPMALPILRIKLKSAAPSVRYFGSSVANATTCNGMNTKPMPKPCSIVVVTIDQESTSGVQAVMYQTAIVIITMPPSIKSRGSIRLDSLPAIIIAIIVPTPRGAIRRPASVTE